MRQCKIDLEDWNEREDGKLQLISRNLYGVTLSNYFRKVLLLELNRVKHEDQHEFYILFYCRRRPHAADAPNTNQVNEIQTFSRKFIQCQLVSPDSCLWKETQKPTNLTVGEIERLIIIMYRTLPLAFENQTVRLAKVRDHS